MKILHYHKIDAFIDKCLKNHLKMRSFDWSKKLLKFEEKNEKFEKNWSLQGLNRGHDSVARQESFKSELATAGAVIHPITYVNSVKYIIKTYLNFEKKRAQLASSSPIFNPTYITRFLMKSHDVNMKVV